MSLQANKTITFTKRTLQRNCSDGLPTGREDSFNNVYKQWHVLAYLENPADFPLASTCLQLSVTNHATAHTPNVKRYATKPTEKNIQYKNGR